MPQLIKESPKKEDICKSSDQECEKTKCSDGSRKPFSNIQMDDIILGVVILVLLMDDEDNSLLLIALAAIFLTGIA